MNHKIIPFDFRRNIVVPGDEEETIAFCRDHFLEIAQESIKKRNAFYVALSGGTTPKRILESIASDPFKNKIDWSKVYIFWSDERAVPPDHPESNFSMAMSSGLKNIAKPTQIYRMKADGDSLEMGAKEYEDTIKKIVPKASFDLVMLGMGEDGHTASLFPDTEGLHCKDRLVIPNYLPQKKSWRMTFTFDCIHQAKLIVLYVMGKNKAETLKAVLEGKYEPNRYPAQRIGKEDLQALWIIDTEASRLLNLPKL